jgi:hypothetical protein
VPHGKVCYLAIAAITAEAPADYQSSIFDWKIPQHGPSR